MGVLVEHLHGHINSKLTLDCALPAVARRESRLHCVRLLRTQNIDRLVSELDTTFLPPDVVPPLSPADPFGHLLSGQLKPERALEALGSSTAKIAEQFLPQESRRLGLRHGPAYANDRVP